MFRSARYYSIGSGSHQVSWEIDQRPLRKSLCWVFCVKRRSNSPSLVFEDGDAPQKEKNQALAGKSHNLLDSRLTVKKCRNFGTKKSNLCFFKLKRLDRSEDKSRLLRWEKLLELDREREREIGEKDLAKKLKNCLLI